MVIEAKAPAITWPNHQFHAAAIDRLERDKKR